MPMVSNFNNVLYILPCTCPLPYLFCTSFNYRKFTMHTVHIHFFILFSIIHSFGSSTECQLWHTILETALIPFRFIFTASVLMVFTHKEKKNTHTKLPNGRNTWKTIRCNIHNLHTDKKIIWNLFIIKYIRDCRESDMQMPAFQRQ